VIKRKDRIEYMMQQIAKEIEARGFSQTDGEADLLINIGVVVADVKSILVSQYSQDSDFPHSVVIRNFVPWYSATIFNFPVRYNLKYYLVILSVDLIHYDFY